MLKKINNKILKESVILPKRRRTTAPILAVILALFPLKGSSSSHLQEGDFTYELIGGGEAVKIIGYTGSEENLTIPEKLGEEEKPVKEIGSGAFSRNSFLRRVVIPDSVTNIGSTAFFDCYELTEVTIPDSVSYIGSIAFQYCDKLMEVTIPDSVTHIGHSVFSGCMELTGITVDINNSFYTSQDGVLFNKTETELLQYPCGKPVVTYVIPASVSSIGYGAFEACNKLTEITIPGSVTSINPYAFFDCTGLTQIDIPDSVISIESYAFLGCTGLTQIDIPDSVISIGEASFLECGELMHVEFGNSVAFIGDLAFLDCIKLTNALFEGNAPTNFNPVTFDGAATGFKVQFYKGAAGFTIPLWKGYSSEKIDRYHSSSIDDWLFAHGYRINQHLIDSTASGLSLLTTYALDLNPTNVNARLPFPVRIGGNIRWTYSTERTDLVIKAESRMNLIEGNWIPAQIETNGANSNASVAFPEDSNQIFLRLKISKP